MQRILIIGSPGSGKSTLARTLAARSGLPLVHLDRLYWQPGWMETETGQWIARVTAAAAEPRWIIDGNYSNTLAPRLARAEMVVLFDMPLRVRVGGILKRLRQYRGRVRDDMAEGCPERFDWAFFRYVVRFRRHSLPRVEAKLAGFAGEVLRLRSRADVARFLDRLDEHAHE